MKETNIFST